MNKWIKVSTLAGAAVLSSSLYFSGVSWAQDTSNAGATPTTASGAPAPGQHRDRWRQQALFSREEKLAMLAETLGMEVAEVQQALRNGQKPRELIQAKGLTRETFRATLSKVLDKHLQQAVTDGRITQQQADQIRQRVASGKGFWQGHGMRDERGSRREARQSERQAILAEVLGMTPEALQSARAAGQTPLELAQAKGMDAAAFRAALQQAAEQHLQQAVKDGRITQAQADRIRARMADSRGHWQWLRAMK